MLQQTIEFLFDAVVVKDGSFFVVKVNLLPHHRGDNPRHEMNLLVLVWIVDDHLVNAVAKHVSHCSVEQGLVPVNASWRAHFLGVAKNLVPELLEEVDVCT